MVDELDGQLGRAVAGDRNALQQLLEVYGPPIRDAVAAQIGRKWQAAIDADDVMQVTYLEAFLHVDRMTEPSAGAFANWLLRIAENNLQDAIKALERTKRPDPRRRVFTSAEDSFFDLFDLLSGGSSSPSLKAARGEVHATLQTMIARLPQDYRDVVRLYDIEERSVSEVAAAMGRSPGAVYMLRARAHERLREMLGSESKFFPRSP